MYLLSYLGWFEMKPYSFNNRIVQVSARFASEKEKDLQPRQEERNEIYRQCADTFNKQSKRKKEEEAAMEALKKERLEIRKQKNSSGLYNRYEKTAEGGWQRGRNFNPGANRQDRQEEKSRSRSRSKGKEQR